MYKKIKSLLVAIGIVVISFSGFLYNVNNVKAESTNAGLYYTRTYGQDRFETSAKLSHDNWSESYYTVLVNGTNFADAITASPIAYQYGAPVLLTRANSIPDVIVNELKRLKTKQIIIIGGTTVVSNNVVSQLNAMGIEIKERIAGADRFDTSIEVSKQLVPENWNAYIVKDDDWISAIMISPLACAEQAPIVYGSDVGLKYEGAQLLRDKRLKNFDILDTNAISSYYRNTNISLTQNITNSVNVNLVGGRTREIFNKYFFKQYESKFNFNTIYVVSNKDFADGLSVATLAGATDSPIFVVGNNNITEVEQYIANNTDRIHNIKIIGGESLIPQDFMDKVWKYNSNMGENNENNDGDWTFGNGEKITNEQATKIVREKTGNNTLESIMEGHGLDTDYTDTGINLSDKRFWWFWGNNENELYYVDVQNGDVYKMIEHGADKDTFQQL